MTNPWLNIPLDERRPYVPAGGRAGTDARGTAWVARQLSLRHDVGGARDIAQRRGGCGFRGRGYA
jgi:hypothetical protein